MVRDEITLLGANEGGRAQEEQKRGAGGKVELVMVAVLKSLGSGVFKSQLELVMKDLDKDKKVFSCFDANNDCQISVSELENVLKSLGSSISKSVDFCSFNSADNDSVELHDFKSNWKGWAPEAQMGYSFSQNRRWEFAIEAYSKEFLIHNLRMTISFPRNN